ncbi:MAG: GSCFA domain-containing protein, partial [Prevotella sp.]|nr:GSCFA domain-containing protein [Prevotella sp.]
MQLTTPVSLPARPMTLQPSDRLMMLGSCFAQHVGEELSHALPPTDIDVNPFGVLYNPLSIAGAVGSLLSVAPPVGHIFHGADGVFHSWLHTSRFSARTEAECRERITLRHAAARGLLQSASLLCVTFGTTRCYRLRSGLVVANCHKEPQSSFTEYEPSVDEIVGVWTDIIGRVREKRPSLHVCFTVSPYRYRKYGFHESQLQKAKLLLAVDRLARENTGVSYFPAYEILLDELRDYRFYAPDMLHPS